MTINFDTIFIGYTLWQWTVSFSVTVLSLMSLILLDKLVLFRLKNVKEEESKRLSTIISQTLKQTKWWFYIAISLLIGLATIEIPKEALLIKGLVLLVMLQIGLWGSEFISTFTKTYGKSKVDQKALSQSALNLFSLFIKAVFWIIIFLLILANLGYEITPLVASLGIGGLAIAFAVQNILTDIFASFSIVIDKPFTVGDFIIVDQYLGSVEHIGIKTTRLRSLSGEELIFSNNDLLKSRIRNYKHMTERRILFNFQISYKTDHQKLRKIPTKIKEIINSIDNTSFDRAHLKELSEYALLYEVVYYVTKPNYNSFMDIQEVINLQILKYFQEQNISLAHPIRVIHSE